MPSILTIIVDSVFEALINHQPLSLLTLIPSSVFICFNGILLITLTFISSMILNFFSSGHSILHSGVEYDLGKLSTNSVIDIPFFSIL